MIFSARRSLLFAPADRPELFAKAAQKGADIICFECEDAVPISKKALAREHLISMFKHRPEIEPIPGMPHTQEYIVRINALDTEEGQEDIQAIIAHHLAIDAVLIPKVNTAEQLKELSAAFDKAGLDIGLMVLIETAEGLENISSILTSTPRVNLALFGGVDLSVEFGCDMSWMALSYARQRMVHAAAFAKIDILDMPNVEIAQLETVREEAALAKQCGFRGKAAIHPAQLPAIHDIFTPQAADIDNAIAICKACDEAGGGAALFQGKMIEKPVRLGAEKLLLRARAIGLYPVS